MNTTILPNGDLEITMDNEEERFSLLEMCALGYQEAESHMAECLHEEYEFVRPEVIGALTDAPILCASDDMDYSDETMGAPFYSAAPLPGAKVYWFPNYAVIDPWEELATKGCVVFTVNQVSASEK